MAEIEFVAPYHRATQSPHHRLKASHWRAIESIVSKNLPSSQEIYQISRKATIPEAIVWKPENLPSIDEKFYKGTATTLAASIVNIAESIRFMPDHALEGYDKIQKNCLCCRR